MKKHIFALGMVAVLAVLLCGCGAGARETNLQETALIIATDLHYLAPELTDHGDFFQRMLENGDGKSLEYCEEIVDAFVNDVIEQKPDALILSGDLTFNGEKLSHEALAEKLQGIRSAGIPVFVMPGNHDLDNYLAVSYEGDSYTQAESVTAQQFSEIYRDFGYDAAYARDKHSRSYMAKLSPELCLLVVDVNGSKIPGSIREETLDWVRRQLAAAERRGMRVLSVSHQNLLQHSPLFSTGYVMYRNDKLLELLEQYDAICHFSGHMHTQHITQSENGLTEIVTSSLMVTPLQYGVLRLEGKTCQYEARQVAVSDEIAAYARDFFWETAYGQALEALGTDDDTDHLAAYFADMNSAYFGGRMDTVEYDTDELKKWKEQDSFLPGYLESMSADAGRDYTRFLFEIAQ